jgi:hypothetical protein
MPMKKQRSKQLEMFAPNEMNGGVERRDIFMEESVALDLSDLYDTEGKPIQMEAFEKWYKEISPIIVDAAVGKSYEKDWDDYNMRGVELAKKLRKQLSQDFALWYEPLFEDSSENKKATLILS